MLLVALLALIPLSVVGVERPAGPAPTGEPDGTAGRLASAVSDALGPDAPPPNRPPALRAPAPPPVAPAAVAAVDGLSAGLSEVRVDAAVFDRERGELVLGRSGADPILSASLSKVIVVVDMLQRARAGGPPVGPREVELIRRALGPSDDDAMNILWSRFDGVGAVSRVSAQLGLTATRPPEQPSQWGETFISAADMVTLYRHVLDVLPAADRDLIIEALAAAPAEATDGFPQDFGLLGTGDRAAVEAKQGWMCCQGGRISLHSAGVLGPTDRYIVALLSSQPSGLGYDGSSENLTAAAAELRRILG